MSEFSQLTYLPAGLIGRITLNRPEKRNALNAVLIAELTSAFLKAEADEDVRVVVLRGAGKDFCSGADLEQLERISKASVLDNRADAEKFASLILTIRQLSKPVIAAVHGRALAGGAGLASACDMVLAARSAMFGYPEVKIGFVAAIVMAILKRNVGEKKAFELLAKGDRVTAEAMERLGLINEVIEDADLDRAVDDVATKLSESSQSALMLTKSLLYQIDGMSFAQALRAGIEMNAIARMTPDCQAGLQRFLAKP
ncbi:MAG: enoyl-CoA hydratase-related protein [Acidobacteriota bacterium]